MRHCQLSLDEWAQGLITKPLEATHGQWIYCNTLVHNQTTGFLATTSKEELQQAIKDQVLLGAEGMGEQD